MCSYAIAALLCLWAVLPARAERLSHGAVSVEFYGITRLQAEAAAKVIAAASQIYAEEFGFRMPERVQLFVHPVSNGRDRLATDAADFIDLAIRDGKDMARPELSRRFQIYGLCHELAHIAMRTNIGEVWAWMDDTTAEAWGQYAGAIVTTRLFDLHGPALWWDPYQYGRDGLNRYRKLQEKGDKYSTRAIIWEEMGAFGSIRGFAKVFRAWQQAAATLKSRSAGRPERLSRLGEVLGDVFPDRNESVELWWRSRGTMFIKDETPK